MCKSHQTPSEVIMQMQKTYVLVVVHVHDVEHRVDHMEVINTVIYGLPLCT